MIYLTIKNCEILFCYESLEDASTMIEELLAQCYEVEITTEEIMAMRKATRGE